MASSFKRTAIKSFPKVGEKITSDTLYWKKLEFPIIRKEVGAISHIDFSPVEPYDFAVTNSTRVQVYSPKTNQPEKTFSRSREVAYSGCFRGDGKLLVAGGEDACMRLFDVQGKSLLRVFKGHKGPVHVTKFTTDKLRVLSGADDKALRVWDIATEKEIISYQEHQDYVRAGATSQASHDIVLSGSYDHTVKLYDTRIQGSVLSVDHGQPVESVLMYPTGGIFITAGGNVVKVWDALAGGRLFTQLCHHHKTVTCLCLCSNNQRLVSGGLDRHVKIYDVSTYQVVHTLDYPGAILSVGVSGDPSYEDVLHVGEYARYSPKADDKVVAVGTADGLLSIRHRKSEDTIHKAKKKKTVSYKYVLKGRTHHPQEGDLVVQHQKREHLAKYDKYFKKFEHSKALDAALRINVRVKHPEVTISVLQELVRRGGIKAALAGRDEKSLGSCLKFIQRNISNPKFMGTLVDISNLILDIYSPQVGHSSVVDDQLHRLKETVDIEVGYMKSLMETIGTMDTLFAISNRKELAIKSAQRTISAELKPSEEAESL